MGKKAIIAGASGSIGNSLVKQLLTNETYTEVLVLVRRDLGIKHPKLQQLVLNFEEINNYAAQITGDVVFCCLGTTKSQTPDQGEYRKIDYQYPLDIAWIAQTNGARSYHLISAIGADKNSSTFYIRTKGEVERDLKAVPFESIHIYRPSLLDGERKQHRILEKISNVVMRVINPLLFGGLKKYRSIRVSTVARAMILNSMEEKKGVFVYESDRIQETGAMTK
jgi:uncharacterized protein YbjT (DUF2867 family)